MPARGRTPGRAAPSPRTSAPPPKPARRPREVVRRLAPPADLYRGYERLSLISDLAMGELSHRELAHRESVTLQEIAEFAKSHEKEIAEVRAALAGQLAIETAGLWITKKQNRLAEYQDQAENIRDELQRLKGMDISWSRSHKDMLKAYLDLLHTVADELGAYPQRASAPARTGQTVHYIIDTPDPAALT